MFQINSDDMSIYLTRGDTALFQVSAMKSETERYVFKPGDIVRIKVFEKKSCDKVVLQKDFGIEEETEVATVFLNERETKFGEIISKPKDYWYEIELNPFTEPQTIVGYDDDGAKVLKLFPEGADVPDVPIEEEDIPIVDSELDLTSTRPVSNHAVSKGFLEVKKNIEDILKITSSAGVHYEELVVVDNETASIKAISNGTNVAVMISVKLSASQVKVYNASISENRDMFEPLNIYADNKTGILAEMVTNGENHEIQFTHMRHNDYDELLLGFTNKTNSEITINHCITYPTKKTSMQEVTDARRDYEGKIYESLGEHVRALGKYSNDNCTDLHTNDDIFLKHIVLSDSEENETVLMTGEIDRLGIVYNTLMNYAETFSNSENVSISEDGSINFNTPGIYKVNVAMTIENISSGFDLNISLNGELFNNRFVAKQGTHTYEFDKVVLISRPTTEKLFITDESSEYLAEITNSVLRVSEPAFIGGVSNKQVEKVVEEYLANNPIEGGATTEQLEQIEKNTKDIDHLNKTIADLTVGTFIDYDLNVKAINHRGYSSQAPENTIPAYILSKQKGFKYVECDVSFTSDGVAVLLHDATIDRTSDGTGNINEMTYADVLTYDFGSWKDSKYEGTKIPTFEEFIKLCKCIGLHPYIELKSNGNYSQEQITEIVNIVKSCGMEGKVTYISFTVAFLGYVKNADSKARLGYLQSYNVNSGHISSAQSLKTDENEVFIDTQLNYLTESGVELCKNADLPLEVWTVNEEKKILEMNPYITGVTSDNLIAGKVLYDNYMVYTEPEVILLGITATYTGGSVNVGTNVTDLGGIVVTANYSDGSTANVTDYTISGNISVGTNTVTITYKNKTTTITVIGIAEDEEEITLSSINVTYTGGEVTEGTPLTSLTGVSVVGTYSDGSISEITGYTLSGNIVVGENTITVSYGGKTTTFTVIGITEVIDTGDAIYYWDFTEGLTDLMNNEVATSNRSITENGFQTNSNNNYIGTTSKFNCLGKRVEIDVASMGDASRAQHARLFSVCGNDTYSTNKNSGAFLWRYNTNIGWSFYTGKEWTESLDATEYPVGFFSGKTIRLDIDAEGYFTLYYAEIGSDNFTKVHTFSLPIDSALQTGYFVIGGNVYDNLHPCVITSMRVYDITDEEA